MAQKLPFDAFDYYLSLGPERSYQAVSEKYGVAKRTVTRTAQQESWQERIQELETKARENASKKSLETLEQMAERHLKQLRVIQVKSLETLRALPLERAMDAVRALDLCMKQERSLRGDPADREELSTEAIIKREYERWMVRVDDEEEAN